MDNGKLNNFMAMREYLSSGLGRFYNEARELLTDIVMEQPSQRIDFYNAEDEDWDIDIQIPVVTKHDTMEINVDSLSIKDGKLIVSLADMPNDDMTIGDVDGDDAVNLFIGVAEHLGVIPRKK